MSLHPPSKEKLRWVTLVFFFLSGIVTASWSSRIPDVQTKLALNDAQWGLVLFAMPVGLFAGLPLSSWIVAKYSARRIMVWSMILFAVILSLLPLALNRWHLAFGFQYFLNTLPMQEDLHVYH